MTTALRVVAGGLIPLPFHPQLVALDLDGTCLDSQQQLHPRTRDAVRQAATRVPVVIATGRMYRSSLPWVEELGARGPVICYQGALVRELPQAGGSTLLEDLLDSAPALGALEVARRHGWHRQAYQNDELLCEEDRREAHIYARIARVDIRFVDDLAACLHNRVTKLVVVSDDPMVVAQCESILRTTLGETARVTRSLPQFVEVVNPSAGKGRALRLVCERLGVPLETTLVIGDAPNDIDLLAAAGFGVAVAHGAQALADQASAICAEPQEGGVADVLAACGLLRD